MTRCPVTGDAVVGIGVSLVGMKVDVDWGVDFLLPGGVWIVCGGGLGNFLFLFYESRT